MPLDEQARSELVRRVFLLMRFVFGFAFEAGLVSLVMMVFFSSYGFLSAVLTDLSFCGGWICLFNLKRKMNHG